MHQSSRQNSHTTTASPRIKLIFFIFFLVLLLTVAVVVYTHKSLDSINSASLYSAEIVALRKYHQNKQKQKELQPVPTPSTTITETKPTVPSPPAFDQKNCSAYVERFLLSDLISNAKESQQEHRRKQVLDKWLHQPLFPPALQLQLLTYKVRVLLKLHSGVNARLWQPLIEETYDHILGLRHDKRLSIQSIDEKLRNFEYDVSFDENARSGTVLNEYQHKCFQEFPECSVWSRSKEIGMSLLIATRNKNNSISISLASQIRAFVKNENKILDAKSFHVLNFVDILMNVKCCTEHKQLKRALGGALQMARQKESGGKSKISFSLTAGSLLAAVRENGYFIPWDTDVDLLIQPEDEEAAKKIIFGGSSSSHQNKNAKNTSASSSECCFTKLLDPPRQTDHGKLLGFVYPVPKNEKPFHEETSRVEIWVASADKKMQKKSVVLPLTRKCSLQEIGGDELPLFCPNKIEKILEGGYGEKWCVACKSKTSNCK